MFLIVTFFLILFFLVGIFLLTSLSSAFRRLHNDDSQKQIDMLGSLFFYRPLHYFFLQSQGFEGLFFSTLCAQNIARFFYAVLTYVFISHTNLFYQLPNSDSPQINDFSLFWIILSFVAFVLAGVIIGDILPRMFGTKMPAAAIRLCAPLSSPFFFLVFPISYIFLKLSHSLSRTFLFDQFQEPAVQAKKEIIDIIERAELGPEINRHDKQLIESVLNFKERIAREVMVPRIHLFCLSSTTTIREAAGLLYSEGYSRTPVYKNNIDNIVGLLMYKDILIKYMEYVDKNHDEKILDMSIESLIKPPIYTPETKKLSNLLQEFRKTQVHLAIVVDEYGGTEGIVTIEDILEAIVGDIADEYDEMEQLYKAQPDKSWIVDAKLSILDAEEELDIKIPQEADYDTIGGYLYHRAGTIPLPGFIIHHEDFEIEVLSSSDRSVDKVRIRALPHE
ncbi:MAG: CBS domain-containing protein [Parachlamydiaceae bacterium]|nr:CBS domain-containing protein [Parachlamydiaceae bacterium]